MHKPIARNLPRGLAAVFMGPYAVVNARLTSAHRRATIRLLSAKQAAPFEVVKLAEL